MRPSRRLYLQLSALLAEQAIQGGDERDALAELLIVINSEDAPERDQDIVDFLSDLYLFVVFGRSQYPEGLKDEADIRRRLESLAGVAWPLPFVFEPQLPLLFL